MTLEPIEYKIKKMYSLEASWKKRDNYIADIIKKYPYVYNSWRGMRFTDKGFRIGNEESWNNFRAFYNDVIPTYKKGLLLRRLDIGKPFAKNNFIWVTEEEAVLLKSNLIWLEYEGRTLTLRQWAHEGSSNLTAIRNRYYSKDKHGYSIRDIIYGRQRNRGSKKSRDYTMSNIRAKASKMISSYKATDFKNKAEICDIDIDWMIENIFSQKCYYCGDSTKVGCDRVDNDRGHTKDNVIPCCIDCNTARGNNFSISEMAKIGEVIKQIKHERNKPEGIA